MTTDQDYYAVLGVLPDAENVVLVAAYRALAGLYHLERWQGDSAVATRRIAEINVAYGVLGESQKRREYDAERKFSHGTYGTADKDQDQAFDDALRYVEERWQLAVGVFPDLAEIRQRLRKKAHRLAFAFVTVMMESK